MKFCRTCAGEIGPTDRECKKCGNPIDREEFTPQPKPQPSKGRGLLTMIIIIGLIIAVLAVFLFLTSSKPPIETVQPLSEYIHFDNVNEERELDYPVALTGTFSINSSYPVNINTTDVTFSVYGVCFLGTTSYELSDVIIDFTGNTIGPSDHVAYRLELPEFKDEVVYFEGYNITYTAEIYYKDILNDQSQRFNVEYLYGPITVP